MIYINAASECLSRDIQTAFSLLQRAIVNKQGILDQVDIPPLRLGTFLFSVIIECKDTQLQTVQKSHIHFIELPSTPGLAAYHDSITDRKTFTAQATKVTQSNAVLVKLISALS